MAHTSAPIMLRRIGFLLVPLQAPTASDRVLEGSARFGSV
jgi:hypothetical protein